MIARDPVLPGVSQTWDDVIDRWSGKQKIDRFYTLGPPQFHQKADDGMEELAWDKTRASMPGQAEIYDALPRYGG